MYSKALFNAAELVKDKFGFFYNGLPHHNMDGYLKSDCMRVSEKIFKNEIDNMKKDIDEIKSLLKILVDGNNKT